MYKYETTIKLHDTDTSGVIFFNNQLKLVHDAYQSMLERAGLSFKDMFKEGQYALPIVHTEADYKTPLTVGDKIIITVTLENISSHSFTLFYTLIKANDKTIAGTAKTVHVTTDKNISSKIPVPDKIKSILERI